MARDLRFIATALKIVRDIERIGDIAVNIAERARELIQEPVLKRLIDFPIMAEAAQRILKESLDAFVNSDVELAEKRGVARKRPELRGAFLVVDQTGKHVEKAASDRGELLDAVVRVRIAKGAKPEGWIVRAKAGGKVLRVVGSSLTFEKLGNDLGKPKLPLP